jgi:hypothetical protein
VKFILFAFLSIAALAQTRTDIPRMPNGKPNFKGVWQHPYVPDMTVTRGDQTGTKELPYTQKGADNFKNYDPAHGDYTGQCLPMGLSRSQNAPYPIQIMQDDDYLSFLFEQGTWFNIVYLDNRPHPSGDALNPNWFGHSVGHWEGDTLVIDTVGFNGKTRLDTIGHPHSDQLHMTQKLKFVDNNHFEYETIIDDPVMYTKPWNNKRIYTRMKPGSELIEYSCEENNKDYTEGHIK